VNQQKQIWVLIPVRLTGKHESPEYVQKFCEHFLKDFRNLANTNNPRLFLLIDDDENTNEAEYTLVQNVTYFMGKGNYGSTLAAFLRSIAPSEWENVQCVVIGDLTEDVFENEGLLYRATYNMNLDEDVCRPLQRTFESDKSVWYRKLGRRFISFLFNTLVIRQILPNQSYLQDVSLSFRAYSPECFNNYGALRDLAFAIRDKNPFETQLILLIRALDLAQQKSVTLPTDYKHFIYHQTKSTLRFKSVIKVLKLIISMSFNLSRYGTWRNIAYKCQKL